MKMIPIVVLVGSLVSIVGCKKDRGAATADAAPAAAEAAKGDPTAGGEWETGVAECDAFIEKYLACIDTRFPEAQRQATREGFKASAKAWKAAAADPNSKAALVEQCQAMQAMVQKSSEQMGCTW